MKYIISIILATFGIAHAGQWGIQVHLHSMHFEDRAYEDWNEETDGFAVRYSFNEKYAIQAGHYRNEQTIRGYNFFANYLLGDYTPVSLGPVRFGGYVGAVAGYNDYTIAPNPENRSHPSRITSETDSGVNPMAGFVARWELYKFNITARLQPNISHAGPAHLATEVGYSF